MSTLKRVTKCDICGKYNCDYDGLLKIKQRQSLWYESWMTRFDICPECSRLMKEWIQMKKDSETSTTVSKAFVIGRNTILNELHAQVAVGNIEQAVADDIMAHLFKET